MHKSKQRQSITGWVKRRSFFSKLCFVIICLFLADHAYEAWLDSVHEFRFKKYSSVEEASAKLARLYPKGTSIKKFQEDMESAGYKCKTGVSDIAPYKGNPETMYFMHCTWHHGFLYWAVWTSVAVYSVDNIITETRANHGWEGL